MESTKAKERGKNLNVKSPPHVEVVKSVETAVASDEVEMV
jgi:hypothetical protein